MTTFYDCHVEDQSDGLVEPTKSWLGLTREDLLKRLPDMLDEVDKSAPQHAVGVPPHGRWKVLHIKKSLSI
jgi:hypothetical protein